MAVQGDDDRLNELLSSFGVASVEIEPLAGDASARRFFRVRLSSAETVVVSLYPLGSDTEAGRDAAVQQWGVDRGLPIPRLLARARCGIMSEDFGDENLETAVRLHGGGAIDPVLTTLAAFQECSWLEATNAPFDAAFFRRELALCESFILETGRSEERRFLDSLAERLAHHPFRLLHRDFHVHNLFWREGAVWAVDFQDMRGGPDTYDAASLLRERGGSRFFDPWSLPERRVAEACAWQPGWQRRLQECGAQRGLKVIGTFLRLASLGRRDYLRWLPEVRSRLLEVLPDVGAPPGLVEAVAARHVLEGV